MLSVQNSETWALSQANPKTKPIFHQTAPVWGFPQNRWRISPNSVADFLKVCNGFSQNRWQIFPKSVTDFLKIGGWFPRKRCQFLSKTKPVCSIIGGWFSQSPWLISSKSGDWLPQNLWRISPKSVLDFPKNCPQISTNPQIPNQLSQNRTNSLPKTGAGFFCSNRASLSLKRIFCCCFNLG